MEKQATRSRPEVDSVQRALAQAGDAWTMLILREAFFGARRFDAFQSALTAAPTVLTDRLKKLVANGVLTRVPYQERPLRHEYRLTDKGRDLYPAIVAIMGWGDRWLADEGGPPLTLVHKACGQDSHPRLVCDVCGEPIAVRDMDWRASAPLAERVDAS